MKSQNIHFRLSQVDYDIIVKTCNHMDISISQLIISLVIPWCINHCPEDIYISSS